MRECGLAGLRACSLARLLACGSVRSLTRLLSLISFASAPQAKQCNGQQWLERPSIVVICECWEVMPTVLNCRSVPFCGISTVILCRRQRQMHSLSPSALVHRTESWLTDVSSPLTSAICPRYLFRSRALLRTNRHDRLSLALSVSLSLSFSLSLSRSRSHHVSNSHWRALPKR